jgi:2-polyprenyl-6-hydroxyphenyl methylase/3-demethylubiquinone-9 3-methyltransferase
MGAVASQLAETVFTKAPNLRHKYHQYAYALEKLLAAGHVTPADIAGKRILDWECGSGVYSLLFVEHGAARCDAIDSWLWTEACQQSMGHLPQIQFAKVSLEEFAADPSRAGAFDFVFANTVTEHMLNLPRQLPLVGRLLRTGGLFVTNHDNYYQPVGSHDHGFLFYGRGAFIEPKGPRCWEAPDKCAASKDHRATIMKDLWWTWDESMEKKLTPADCTKCPYYKRSQPWAHLLHQAEFRDVYPQPCFTTGYVKSSLNKITPFQLKQFVIEAGFDITAWIANRLTNEPPETLLKPPFGFSREDLQTATITVVARKAHSPYGE